MWLQRMRKIVAPKTLQRRLTSLKTFAKWAGWPITFEEYIGPKVPKSDPHPLPEGIDGVYRLMDSTRNEKQLALIALCGLFGCRIGEALDCDVSWFDLDSMNLTIRGKGDKIRVVPISDRAWTVLAPIVTRAWLLGSKTKVVGLKDRYARRVISDLGKRAGLKRHISSHDLRATFGTHVYDETLDIRVVQELLGHSSVETTEIYTGINDKKKRDAVNWT